MPHGRRPSRPAGRLSVLVKALASEARLSVLFLLAEHGELSVTAIAERLGLAQPAASLHLAVLKGAGLVGYRREGKFHHYSLHPTGLRDLIDPLFPRGGPARLTLGGVEVSFRRL